MYYKILLLLLFTTTQALANDKSEPQKDNYTFSAHTGFLYGNIGFGQIWELNIRKNDLLFVFHKREETSNKGCYFARCSNPLRDDDIGAISLTSLRVGTFLFDSDFVVATGIATVDTSIGDKYSDQKTSYALPLSLSFVSRHLRYFTSSLSYDMLLASDTGSKSLSLSFGVSF